MPRSIGYRICVAAAIAAVAGLVADPAFSRGGRGGGVRSGGATSVRSGGSGGMSRPSSGGAGYSRPGGGTTRSAGGGDNRVNSGNRVNTGDVNINRNTTINGDVDGWGGWDDRVHHPVAAGMAVGAAAAVTAAAIGSSYYALPPGCPPYPYGGYTYYSCGGAYYEPRYEGSTVVYVTVPPPGG